MQEVLASIREFSSKIIRHVYSVAVGVIGGVLGTVDAISAASAKPETTPFSVPLWVWLPLLAAGFLVAIFRAFHDVRTERDRARSDLLRYALRPCGVSLKGIPGGADTVDVQLQLRLKNHSDEPVRLEIEDVSTAIEGKSGRDDHSGSSITVIPPDETNIIGCPPVRGLPSGWHGEGSLGLTARYGHAEPPPQYRVRWEYKLQFFRTGQEIQIKANPVRDIEVEDI